MYPSSAMPDLHVWSGPGQCPICHATDTDLFLLRVEQDVERWKVVVTCICALVFVILAFILHS